VVSVWRCQNDFPCRAVVLADSGGAGMKQKIYMRISKDGKVDASNKFKNEPLRDGYKHAKSTVYLALMLEIPDVAFQPPTISASISVPIEKVGSCVEVVDPLVQL
jgi:hypothetical protein